MIFRSPAVLSGLLLSVSLGLGALGRPAPVLRSLEAPALAAGVHAPSRTDEGCIQCHKGIEEMHPGFPLSCTDCHGGDGAADSEDDAHVASKRLRSSDERVAPLKDDLAYVRFVNPMDLRVAQRVCGDCHGDLVDHLMLSLHGTTAGHLSDGFFESGLQPEKDSRYSVFPVAAPKGEDGHTVPRLVQPPRIDSGDDPLDLGTHFPDLVRKECMQCHLWSEGRAVRGRLGFDGEYRGGGCAACHVPYRSDGLSQSRDRSANRVEPGHPRTHTMVTSPPTETCTTCHFGDASIGLHFRGLSQLPPGAPGGPEIDGTTDALLHRAFFINDPAVTPPDVHHASGMHCVDCHTLGGVMGDGRLVSKMEEATEITCQACHGTFEKRTDFKTETGATLKHLFERDGSVWMRSKVTGAEHRIKQAVDVLSPGHGDYNEKAALAMTGAHGDVACYTCHGGWNVNFLGFHFYRNEALTQLDLLTGERTKGRVTTQEKVFTTWKSFYAGYDEKGHIAPYLTGFSTMGTVDAEDGTRILDQELPVTANGLSGMTMIHHQLHSTRPTARTCVECHRASETWGMGSANFQLGRQLAFVADRRGIEILAFDREKPQVSAPLNKFVLPDVIDLEVQGDPLHAHAQVLFATEGRRGLHAIDVRDPRAPKRLDFHMTVSPRGMALAGSYLYLADGVGGLKVFDVSDPSELRRVATVPMIDAHEVEVRWPYAYVADGPGGLVVVDIRLPVKPKVVGGLELEGTSAIDLDVLFQYSRPTVRKDGKPSKRRTPTRRLIAVCDEEAGPVLVDATEPRFLKLVEPVTEKRTSATARREDSTYTGVVIRSHVDLASPQGGVKTVERDLMYFAEERGEGGGNRVTYLRIVDVSNPERQAQVSITRLGGASEMVQFGAWYNAPFLAPLIFAPGQGGVLLADVANSSEVAALGTISGIFGAYVFAAEAFPLDAMLDADGRRLKDVSHPKSRWLMRGEIDKVLSVDPEDLGTVDFYDQESSAAGSSARALFARADKDGSGLLVGKEIAAGGGSSLDEDGDGRVSLAEMAKYAETAGKTVVQELEVVIPEGPGTRVAPDGDLARLLDGLDPHVYDKNRDGRLNRKEAKAAVFAALDLDGSGRLDVHELSRAPGDLRTLRLGEASRTKAYAHVTKGKGGTVNMRDFRLRDEDWTPLDPNGDGECQLGPLLEATRSERGYMPPQPEWPTRRMYRMYDVPTSITAARLLETFDKDGDGELTRREMKSHPRLFFQADQDRSTVVEADEVARVEALVRLNGTEAIPDAYGARWDLDGDGKVEAEELPPVVRTLIERRTRK